MNSETITALADKLGVVADNFMIDDIIAATSLFLAGIIKEQDLPLNRKLRLVDDIAVSMKKFMRGQT